MKADRRFRMLDLFAGLGGASNGMRFRGWDVVTVDANPHFQCTVTADLLTWVPPADLGAFDLVWASPPCEEFSRHGMPWLRKKNPPPPSLDLVQAAIRIIDAVRSDWWVVENVTGSSKFLRPLLGVPQRYGAAMLWGRFPELRLRRSGVKPGKRHMSSTARARRAEMPLPLSMALAMAVERAKDNLFAEVPT